MTCEVCGRPTFGKRCGACNGEVSQHSNGPDAGGIAFRCAREALRWLAKQKCDKDNCGTVCLCPPCLARKAMEYYEPSWHAQQ